MIARDLERHSDPILGNVAGLGDRDQLEKAPAEVGVGVGGPDRVENAGRIGDDRTGPGGPV